ncbi:Ubiquitin-conjugating enzyme/RWD-like protein [Niveomyces insectorum RCEF 264]|uniref:Ubiquitin-conjugating enzyme/RWD-like protein n=1 Tax=Niveomyces insectorum RCEF 264 TaxID=1081102 RepID=A0A167LNS2_9HYPO|nr:Ubiquitin-conjugating enzyme/RWD-like protein [Niveomyces insectorum RCEF 264]
MASGRVNAKSPTVRRILREAQELAAAPSADFAANPLETDLFEWHFTLRGPPSSVYAEGAYHGRILLPPTYPLRPPSFRFVTPSGRFEANREICLSISGHHEETWQPAWSLRTALVALRAFMETDPRGQVGGLDASDAVRRRLASESSAYRCATCGRSNAAILQENAAAVAVAAAKRKAEAKIRDAVAAANSSSSSNNPVLGTPTVPPEMRFIFRDELELSTGAASESGNKESNLGDGDAPSPAKKPLVSSPLSQSLPSISAPLSRGCSPPPAVAAAPFQTVPIPTTALLPPEVTDAADAADATGEAERSVITISSLQPQPSPQPSPRPLATTHSPPQVALRAHRLRHHSDDAVPLWVDRCIVALCVVLIGALLRMVFA